MFIIVSSIASYIEDNKDVENIYTISIINPTDIDSFANTNINSIVYKLDINHINHDLKLINILIEDELKDYVINLYNIYNPLIPKYYKINLANLVTSLYDVLDFLNRTPNDYTNYTNTAKTTNIIKEEKEEEKYQKFKEAFETTTFEILDPPGYIIDNKNKSYIYFTTFQDLKNFYYKSEEEKYVIRWSQDKERKIKELFEFS